MQKKKVQNFSVSDNFLYIKRKQQTNRSLTIYFSLLIPLTLGKVLLFHILPQSMQYILMSSAKQEIDQNFPISSLSLYLDLLGPV